MEKSILDFRHSLIILNISTAAAVLLLIFGVSHFTVPADTERERIVVNVVPDTSSLLLAVADQAGFFKANGLEAELRSYPDDLSALMGLENGTGMFATVSRETWADIAGSHGVPGFDVLASIAERSTSRSFRDSNAAPVVRGCSPWSRRRNARNHEPFSRIALRCRTLHQR